MRVQPENWNFFDVPGKKTDYGFLGVRTRIGALYQEDILALRVELQDVQLLALPTSAVAPSPQGSLGQGGNYFSLGNAADYNTLGVRKLYLRLGERDKTCFQIGRFDYYSGLEQPSTDPIVDWMKKERVSKKMIGCPDYNTWSRTFDGARLDVDTEPVHFTAVVLRPTEIAPQFADAANHVLVSNLAATFKEGEVISRGEGQLFWNHYTDDRPVNQVDNLPAHRTIAQDGGNDINTYGFHYLTRVGEDGDFLVWAAHQDGRWGTEGQSANAFAAEAGIRFPNIPWHPWLRAGISVYGGDPSPHDGQHNTFIAEVPDNRIRFPLYTVANVRDPKLQLMLRPREDTKIRMDYHWLSLDSAQDLWYTGSGVGQDTGVNGYSGRPSGGYKDLGRLYELWIDHQLDANDRLVLHYGRAWGGQVVRFNFPHGADGRALYLEYHLTLP
ncbi:unnamed protein product [Phaeothamnion confervicola]